MNCFFSAVQNIIEAYARQFYSVHSGFIGKPAEAGFARGVVISRTKLKLGVISIIR